MKTTNVSRRNKSASVSEPQISQPSTASVKAAPATARVSDAFGLKEILVPIDFSEQSRSALRYALALGKKFQDKLTLLYVVEPIPYPYDFGAAFPLVVDTKDVISEANTRLADFANTGRGNSGCKIARLVRVGQPFHEICASAEELKTDLIVIATHGYTGLKHVLLGSTAERVVRHASCPVLVVRQNLPAETPA